jgi:hypothetical protein
LEQSKRPVRLRGVVIPNRALACIWHALNSTAQQLELVLAQQLDFDQRIEVSPGVAVLALFPGALILVPPYVSVWNTGDRIGRAQGAARLSDQCNPWLGLILAFIFGLHSFYYQMSLNSLWASYDTPPEGSQVPLRA